MMSKGFTGIGHCAKCGDTQGPWTHFKGVGWLCDICADEYENSLKEKENVRCEEQKDE